jgi:cytoskeletal protein CcmA (bactofilin family)
VTLAVLVIAGATIVGYTQKQCDLPLDISGDGFPRNIINLSLHELFPMEKVKPVSTTSAVNTMFDRSKDKQGKIEAPAPVATSVESNYPGVTKSAPGRSAILGSTIRIKGDLSGDENLVLEGRVEGSVNLASHELTIGKAGKVHANITAKIIRVDGEVQGDITGKEKVVLSASSHVKGNIVTPKMTLEEGARFKGTIDIDPAHANNGTAAAVFKVPETKTS